MQRIADIHQPRIKMTELLVICKEIAFRKRRERSRRPTLSKHIVGGNEVIARLGNSLDVALALSIPCHTDQCKIMSCHIYSNYNQYICSSPLTYAASYKSAVVFHP